MTPPASARWLVASLCAALLLNMVGFANIAVVLPAVSADLGLDAGQAGLLGGAFFFAYALGVPLFVPLTDRLPPLAIYTVGSVCWVAGGLCIALADNGIALPLAGRALSGFGMAATFMPGLLMLVARLPADRRSAAAATYSSCITLGTGFCFAVTGAVALTLPWRAAFAAASLTAALALMLVVIVIVRTPPQVQVEAETDHAPDDDHPFGFLVKRRLIGLFAAVAGNAWEGMAFRTWWIAYLVFVTGGKPDGERLAQLAIVTALAGLLAMPISVAVARRAQGPRRVPLLVLACIASGTFALVPPLLANLPLPVVILLTTLYLCLVFADAGTLSAAVLDESPPARRGIAMAASATISNVAAFSGTAAVGAVLGLAGGPTSQSAWLAAFATMGLGSVAGGGVLWVVNRQIRQTQHLNRSSEEACDS